MARIPHKDNPEQQKVARETMATRVLAAAQIRAAMRTLGVDPAAEEAKTALLPAHYQRLALGGMVPVSALLAALQRLESILTERGVQPR